jgi:hypothetical protein
MREIRNSAEQALNTTMRELEEKIQREVMEAKE